MTFSLITFERLISALLQSGLFCLEFNFRSFLYLQFCNRSNGPLFILFFPVSPVCLDRKLSYLLRYRSRHSESYRQRMIVRYTRLTFGGSYSPNDDKRLDTEYSCSVFYCQHRENSDFQNSPAPSIIIRKTSAWSDSTENDLY